MKTRNPLLPFKPRQSNVLGAVQGVDPQGLRAVVPARVRRQCPRVVLLAPDCSAGGVDKRHLPHPILNPHTDHAIQTTSFEALDMQQLNIHRSVLQLRGGAHTNEVAGLQGRLEEGKPTLLVAPHGLATGSAEARLNIVHAPRGADRVQHRLEGAVQRMEHEFCTRKSGDSGPHLSWGDPQHRPIAPMQLGQTLVEEGCPQLGTSVEAGGHLVPTQQTWEESIRDHMLPPPIGTASNPDQPRGQVQR
mmetsp:Transcript_21414/g.38393  ORF Transcript_21414/g.38393 Transcript_21414/m.38393 type:complete len:247 (-) Transcript_21414:31-771(-)